MVEILRRPGESAQLRQVVRLPGPDVDHHPAGSVGGLRRRRDQTETHCPEKRRAAGHDQHAIRPGAQFNRPDPEEIRHYKLMVNHG